MSAAGRARSLGLTAVLVQLVCASIVATISLAAGGSTIAPPETIPRGIALGLLYATPAAIGYLGVRRGRPGMLLAAAIADIPGSILSFVSLVFIVPAVMFAVAAGIGAAPGQFRSAGSALSSALLTLVVAGMLIGAGVSLITQTEERCWIAISTATGTEYRVVPSIEGVPLSGEVQAAGCDGGVLTTGGLGIAGVLAIGAIAFAATATMPHRGAAAARRSD